MSDLVKLDTGRTMRNDPTLTTENTLFQLRTTNVHITSAYRQYTFEFKTRKENSLHNECMSKTKLEAELSHRIGYFLLRTGRKRTKLSVRQKAYYYCGLKDRLTIARRLLMDRIVTIVRLTRVLVQCVVGLVVLASSPPLYGKVPRLILKKQTG